MLVTLRKGCQEKWEWVARRSAGRTKGCSSPRRHGTAHRGNFQVERSGIDVRMVVGEKIKSHCRYLVEQPVQRRRIGRCGYGIAVTAPCLSFLIPNCADCEDGGLGLSNSSILCPFYQGTSEVTQPTPLDRVLSAVKASPIILRIQIPMTAELPQNAHIAIVSSRIAQIRQIT
jgi:hypothetical protein